MLTALLFLLCSSGFAAGPTLDLSSLMNQAAAQAAPVAEAGSPNARYAIADIGLVRWQGQAASSGDLKQGDTVEIVARGEGGLVRVRRGTDFGWVPESNLSLTPVERAPGAADAGESDAAPPAP